MANTSTDQIRAREEEVLFKTYGRYPLWITHGRGCKLYTQAGEEYIDLLAGIAVCNLGHAHPGLIQVLEEQAQRLWHVSNLFYQQEQLELAERLRACSNLGRAFFCNSGAEANEGAIKLARRYQQRVKEEMRYELITLEGSFHGRTLATLTATGQDKVKDGFSPLPEGFVIVPRNDLQALDRAIGPQTAGVMVEIIQGEGGVLPLDREYLRAVQEICNQQGVLFIVDEVQTGMGRSGSWWAHQLYGLEPDIMTVAKALANGLPMGAVLAREEIARGFGPGSHATTFGGGPLLSVVAGKVIELIDDGLVQRAGQLGSELKAELKSVQGHFPDRIAEVRGQGLMLGIELTFQGHSVFEQLLEKGFICNLTQDRVIRLLPPLIVSSAELEGFVRALQDILHKKI